MTDFEAKQNTVRCLPFTYTAQWHLIKLLTRNRYRFPAFRTKKLLCCFKAENAFSRFSFLLHLRCYENLIFLYYFRISFSHIKNLFFFFKSFAYFILLVNPSVTWVSRPTTCTIRMRLRQRLIVKAYFHRKENEKTVAWTSLVRWRESYEEKEQISVISWAFNGFSFPIHILEINKSLPKRRSFQVHLIYYMWTNY